MATNSTQPAVKVEGYFNWVPFFREMLFVICKNYDKKSLKEVFDELQLDAYVDCDYMDPLTFIAYLNIGGGDRKIKLCKRVKALLNLKSKAPTHFLGIPVFDNRNPIFFRNYSKDRDESALDILWKFATDLNEGNISPVTFNDCIGLNGVGLVKLSQFIFITCANNYFPCDLYTRAYLNIQTATTGGYEAYEAFQRAAKNISKGRTPFEVSYRAWLVENKGLQLSNIVMRAEVDKALELLNSIENVVTDNISGVNKPEKNEDFLYRNTYAEVLANFIKNKKTKTPLNIGICARWGEGKSHLIGLLEESLNKKAKDYQKDVEIVKFDAWRYNDQDKIWAAMIMEILKTCQSSFWSGVLFELKYIVFRLCSACSIAKLVGICLTAILLACLLVIYPDIFTKGKILMYPWQWVILVALLIALVPGFIQSPYFNIKSDFLKCLNLPTYENYVGFHSGVQSITKLALQHLSRGGKKKIVLFIDNLDRCSKENIASILDAICQFLDICDDKNELVAVLAIDYQIIQDAVISIKEINRERVDEYMDKIVDFPIFIPKAKDISLLAEKALDVTEEEKFESEQIIPENSDPQEDLVNTQGTTETEPQPKKEVAPIQDSDIALLSGEEKRALVKALSNLHRTSSFAPRYIRKLMNLFIVFKALFQNTLVLNYKKYIWWFSFILRHNGKIDKDNIENVRAMINNMSATERLEDLYKELVGSGSTIAEYIASQEFETVFETSSVFIKPYENKLSFMQK